MNAKIVGAEEIIMCEIADETTKRDNVALSYALGIASDEDIDYGKINRAIVARWSFSALDYIKRKAWKIIESETR